MIILKFYFARFHRLCEVTNNSSSNPAQALWSRNAKALVAVRLVKVRILWCTLSCHNHHVMAQLPGSTLYELVIYPNLVLSHGKPVVIPGNSAHWVLIHNVQLLECFNAWMAHIQHEVTHCASY